MLLQSQTPLDVTPESPPSVTTDTDDRRVSVVNEHLGWLRDVRLVQPATTEAYGRTLFGWHQWCQSTGVDFMAPSPEDCESFLGRKRGRGVGSGSAATRRRDLQALKSFFKWAVARRIVEHDPTPGIGTPKVRNRDPKPLGDQDWQRLWAAPMDPLDRVWIGLAAFGGLRRAELLGLDADQIDWPRATAYGVVRKGGGQATVEYGTTAWAVAAELPHLLPDPDSWTDAVGLLAEQRMGEKLIPGNQEAPWVLNRRLAKVAATAGVRVTPHMLRHTCATNLARCGFPIELIADVLDHDSTDTTMRYLGVGERLARWRKPT